ncbi:MAG: tripartite tricarboxylate transporter permease [Archaeoglobaceae archaeon]
MWYELAIGIILGTIAGLVPGIHSNTFAALLLLAAPNFGDVGVIIISSAITYTVVNIIPATFLGVPDEDTALSVLPSHKMVLEGRGFEVITISALASFLSIVISLPLYLTIHSIAHNYSLLRFLTPYVLIFIAFFLIFSEKGEPFAGRYSAWLKRTYALLIFLISGFLGYVALKNSQLFEIHPAGSVLLPLLTGLFATPVLVFSSSNPVPEQKKMLKIPDLDSVTKGTLAGFFVSLFPGISSGVATVVSTLGEKKEERYISAISAANSANAILCLFFYIVTNRTRSGAADALKKLHYYPEVLNIIVLAIISAFAALLVTIAFGYLLSEKISKFKAGKLSLAVLGFLIILIGYLTGPFGLILFFAASFIGILAVRLKVKRVNCMGCLMLPVIIYYLTHT